VEQKARLVRPLPTDVVVLAASDSFAPLDAIEAVDDRAVVAMAAVDQVALCAGADYPVVPATAAQAVFPGAAIEAILA
jgi:hypothetical protein